MTAGKESPAGPFAASAKAGRGVGTRIGCLPRAAFTLMEILISLALVALLIGATISVVPHDNTSMTTDEVFWKALTEARKQALTSQQDVRLAYDNKAKAFVTGVNIGLPTDAGDSKQTGAKDDTQTGVDGVEQSFPVAFADKLSVDFLTTDKSGGSMLIGGELVETQSLPFVTFYSDGTCTPFRMQIHSGGAARIIAIDPWTCAEVLEEKK